MTSFGPLGITHRVACRVDMTEVAIDDLYVLGNQNVRVVDVVFVSLCFSCCTEYLDDDEWSTARFRVVFIEYFDALLPGAVANWPIVYPINVSRYRCAKTLGCTRSPLHSFGSRTSHSHLQSRCYAV